MEKIPQGQSGEIIPHGPNLDRALRDGHRVHGFRSGGGLRVISIENEAGELVGYGEAPQVIEALTHASLDYELGHETYEQQYSSDRARYPHYWSGAAEVDSPLDAHLLHGATFDAHKDKWSDNMVVSLVGTKFGPEVPEGLEEYVTTSMKPVTFEDRGITYTAEPSGFTASGDQGITIRVTSNPHNIASSYTYAKIGVAPTFREAVTAAFEAPETELMPPNGPEELHMEEL